MAGFGGTQYGRPRPPKPPSFLPGAPDELAQPPLDIQAPTPAPTGIQTQFGPTPEASPTFQAPAPLPPDPRIGELKQRLSQTPAPMRPYVDTPDPQIEALMAELRAQAGSATRSLTTRLSGLDQPLSVRPIDAGKFDSQAAPLRALISELMQGRGPDIGDIKGDKEAQAYRVAKLRESERLRRREANRLAATGLSGSGDFDTSVRGIEEGAGEDISSFEAELTGRRRKEATANALQGANLSLADIGRQEAGERSRFESEFGLERARRGDLLSQAQLEFQGSQGKGASLQALLSAMMAQDAGSREGRFRASELEQRGRESNRASDQQLLNTLLAEEAANEQAGTSRTRAMSDEAMSRLQRELAQQAVDEGAYTASKRKGGYPVGTRFGPFGGAVPAPRGGRP